MPLGTDRLDILAWVDNDVKVFVDGIDAIGEGSGGSCAGPGAYRIHEGCADVDPLSFQIPAGGFFTPGEAVTLTFELRHRGVIGYADFTLTAVALA